MTLCSGARLIDWNSTRVPAMSSRPACPQVIMTALEKKKKKVNTSSRSGDFSWIRTRPQQQTPQLGNMEDLAVLRVQFWQHLGRITLDRDLVVVERLKQGSGHVGAGPTVRRVLLVLLRHGQHVRGREKGHWLLVECWLPVVRGIEPYDGSGLDEFPPRKAVLDFRSNMLQELEANLFVVGVGIQIRAVYDQLLRTR